ncbi:unnamed protein product [Clavelina lepadiformis]|uniref:Uncharacterized protein n=1 Tax=Clavelina lepadiformis TaxID=159417 RepID=A0ABP0EZS8_CLALP
MSAIVTQLSYNINEKLRLDDHPFAFPQHHTGKTDSPSTSVNKATSFSPKEPCGQWSPSATVSSLSFISSASVATTTSTVSSERQVFSSSGAVVGVACQRFPHPRGHSRRDLKYVNLNKTLERNEERTQTTLYQLHEVQEDSLPKCSRHSVSQTNQDKAPTSKKIIRSNTVLNSDKQVANSIEAEQSDIFPSIVGRSCTLHSPKKVSTSSFSCSAFADVPATKRHCRSVSEPEDLFDFQLTKCHSASPTMYSWRPGLHSRVWVHPRKSHQRAYSASTSSSRQYISCSRSLDCGSLHSNASFSRDSLLTPPASPVPRPASVTVIKKEGGAWTFLSSQHSLSRHYQESSFSPLSSPCPEQISPSSSRSHELANRNWSHTGLSATKRSLSFSDDFEHRESVQYTPTSTPELERRFDQQALRHGGLLRCQSHPSDLNMRRMKGRKRGSCRTNRPTLDFAKMKQTSLNKRNRCRERNSSGTQHPMPCTNSWSAHASDMGQIPGVKPIFPSIVATDASNKNMLKLQPVPSASPPAVLFSIGTLKPLSDIRRRIPSPTDEVVVEHNDMIVGGDNDDVATASGGVVSSFVRECNDLNVNDIENETDDEVL